MTTYGKTLVLALAITGWADGGIAQEAGTVVPEGEMTMFCQKAAAARFEVQPDAITTDPPVRREGKLVVMGTVDDEGTDRDAGFDCRFEENGAYIGIIGAPGD
ncbi:hypothetical protein ABUE31_10195 [Mesorhizobium sp. ZMM04-5]|uniref:Uncharacterized protein n=1 Tax=Mesorhizobium marinum TaxID=3228790 RepID=A0ABV3QZ42_9HYPH